MIVSMLARIVRAIVPSVTGAGLLAAALVQQPGALAQQQPSTNAILLAREIILAKGGSKPYEEVIAGVIDRAKGMLLQTNPMVSKDLNEIAAKIRTDAAPQMGEMLNEVAKMYAARFTEPELKEALAFYKSPVGQKMILQETAILDDSVALAQSWALRFSEKVLVQMRAEMKKRGHDL